MSNLSYKDAGVDIDAGNELVERIKPAIAKTTRPEVLTGLGGFAGLFELPFDRYQKPVLVSGTDGVGTKLKLALQTGKHDGVGIDLVAMCVNDIIVTGAEPLFFLDYYATGKLDVDVATRVVEGIAEGCVQAGAALVGGETAEMPGMYSEGDYDLAGFSVGIAERDNIIDGSKIAPGDLVLGLASSGPHSNGYSLIRKVLETSGASLDQDMSGTPLVDALMAPTRIYVKSLLELQAKHPVHGLVHITGGGFWENIPRVLPNDMGVEIDRSSWQWPDVFNWLAEAGNISEHEMLRTFNCGIGMVVIVSAEEMSQVVAQLESTGETVYQLGEVIQREADEDQVSIA